MAATVRVCIHFLSPSLAYPVMHLCQWSWFPCNAICHISSPFLIFRFVPLFVAFPFVLLSQGGQLSPIDLIVEERSHLAAPSAVTPSILHMLACRRVAIWNTYVCTLSVQICACTQGGQLSPIDLIVEERFHRAAPGGMGGTKAAGNYSPVLVTQLDAKKAGYAGGHMLTMD